MSPLPRLMVAPTGARRTKADHPALPITIAEIVACAAACHAAGSDGLHAHVRDTDGQHVLDAGLYRELLAEMAHRVPEMQVQITTEAVERYRPSEQRHLVETLCPRSVSIALREITDEPDTAITRRFFAFCAEADIAVQHILYDATDVTQLCTCIARGLIPAEKLQILHVLGRYSEGQVSSPKDLDPPLAAQSLLPVRPDWAVCAFGPSETACLLAAHRRGAKVRIGFENNLFMDDGSLAPNNSDRVTEFVRMYSD